MTRQRHAGLRKRCDCPRKRWSECPHAWHVNFKWQGQHYRFSLDKELRTHIDSKSAADAAAETLRGAIRDGTFRAAGVITPQVESLTLAQLFATYRKHYVDVHRVTTARTVGYMVKTIERTILELPDGTSRAFGEWLVADISTEVIEHYRQVRLTMTGATGTNRHLEVLRHLFGWATSRTRKLATENPFLDGSKPAIKLLQELPRNRRLRGDEATRLLDACTPHLWAVVNAAIETGMRRGEILSLTWEDVTLEPKGEIVLPAKKTKTKTDRRIPISSTLRAILEMRRHGPDGGPQPPRAAVFGNEVGEPVKDIKRAWTVAVLKAHGHTPQWRTKVIEPRDGTGIARTVRTGDLTPTSLAQYHAIDLHFHDLRREAGSRWLDAGVPLHRIQKWLGHTNISQTSTYLATDAADDDQAMERFEARWRALVQQRATNPETPGKNRPPSATMPEQKRRFSSKNH